jgi:hypothetical protein
MPPPGLIFSADLPDNEHELMNTGMFRSFPVPAMGRLSKTAARNAAVLLLLALLAWNSINYCAADRLDTDPGIFAAVGLHLLHGKVLYREVWDHKPPMVFALDAVALGVGHEDLTAIRYLQRIFAVLGVLLIFGITWIVFRKTWLASLAGFFYLVHFYRKLCYLGGNFTEEYGAVFVLGGILTAVLSLRVEGKNKDASHLLSGLLFALAALTKEPFLLTSIPWFFSCLFLTDRSHGKPLRAGVCFLAGAALPGMAWIFYLIANRAFLDWLDVMDYGFRYCREYAQNPLLDTVQESLLTGGDVVFGYSWLWKVLALAGMASSVCRPFLRETSYFPLLCLYSLALDFVGATIGGRFATYYYLQVVPSWILIGACGFAFLLWASQAWKRIAIPVLVSLGVALIADAPILKTYLISSLPQETAFDRGPISTYLCEHAEPGDTLWVNNGHMARCYAETGLLSPIPRLAVFSHHFLDTLGSSGAEKRMAVQDGLREHPPKFIVDGIPPSTIHEDPALDDFFTKHYAHVESAGKEGTLQVYVRKADLPE